MKKLYNKKGKVHPTPPTISDHLAFLPATILALTAALSPEDRECNCFRCYMSYWVRWDASPNRKLIHDVIDAFEEEELMKVKQCSKKGKKEKKKMNGRDLKMNNINEQESSSTTIVNHDDQVEINGGDLLNVDQVEGSSDDVVAHEDGVEERGSVVRRFVSFVGEKIWGVWG
ncbi:hypothetical protein Sjap_025147 [Stephania japonica]|uniref:Uncharacterized protein n=1 Tax=Stephania japonica TaxID=461633 RepID=A0AAP0HHP8_9MAGN